MPIAELGPPRDAFEGLIPYDTEIRPQVDVDGLVDIWMLFSRQGPLFTQLGEDGEAEHSFIVGSLSDLINKSRQSVSQDDLIFESVACGVSVIAHFAHQRSLPGKVEKRLHKTGVMQKCENALIGLGDCVFGKVDTEKLTEVQIVKAMDRLASSCNLECLDRYIDHTGLLFEATLSESGLHSGRELYDRMCAKYDEAAYLTYSNLAEMWQVGMSDDSDKSERLIRLLQSLPPKKMTEMFQVMHVLLSAITNFPQEDVIAHEQSEKSVPQTSSRLGRKAVAAASNPRQGKLFADRKFAY